MHLMAGMCCDVMLMRHHNDGDTGSMQLAQKLHDLIAGGRVEIARRLVGQQDGRIIGQGAGHGHPLLLPTGEFRRAMTEPVSQAHPFGQIGCARSTLLRLPPLIKQRQFNVFLHRHLRDQIKTLEDKSDPLETDVTERIIAQPADVFTLALERAERKARANIAEAEARYSARRAGVQREQVSTRDLRTRIENCRIEAPSAGMVIYAPQGNRWQEEILQEGLSVRERQELIYLPTADAMSAEVRVHESLLNKIKVGQEATITVDALPGEIFTGTITNIAVMPEDGGWRNPDLKEYVTDIAINETSPYLRSGMTCQAEVQVAHFDEALTVPVQSVLRVDDQPTVFTPGWGGRPVPVPVKVGMDNNRKIQILDGLSAGTEVLLNPPLEEAERRTADAPPPEDGSSAQGKS